MTIYHLACRPDWDAGVAQGEYRVSTRGLPLDEVGFIHASFADQVTGTASRFFGDVQDDLLVLELDEEAIAASGVEVKEEEVAGEVFPHVYGAIRPELVIRVIPFSEWG